MYFALRKSLYQSINHRNILFLYSRTTIISSTIRTFSNLTPPTMSSSPSKTSSSLSSENVSDQTKVEDREQIAEEKTTEPSKYAGTGFSVFGQGITKIHDVPMSVIRRPIPSELDEDKMKVFMEEVARGDEFTPIEVLRVRDPSDPSKSYYYSVGGCHRFEAHKRLQKETIRGKIIEVPAGVMRPYLVNPPF